ncbi:hypothetical protein [Polymorphospora lycopeni]|uniref:Single-stranded DNA-binding protein n=1 Tax=Polymorphospora lycopeni TaxID=3140240 RepID=A0ABV5D239_9ACTN
MTAPAPARTYVHHEPITATGRLSDVIIRRTGQGYDWATATLTTPDRRRWPLEVWWAHLKTARPQLANGTWVTVTGEVHTYNGPARIIAKQVTAAP